MIYTDYYVLFDKANRFVNEDLFALKSHYGFSEKLTKFLEIINIDILPEFKKCIDDFNIIIYNHNIKKKLGLKKGLVNLVNKLSLDVFSDVFEELQWSAKSGITKEFSKEKFTPSALDLKLNTLLSIYRSSYDISFCVSDLGAVFIFAKLNQIYDNLSKIKKGIIYNTFQMQFEFKKPWGVKDELLCNQTALLKQAGVSDDILVDVFSELSNLSEYDNFNELSDLNKLKNSSNFSLVNSNLKQILDNNYTLSMFLFINKNKNKNKNKNIFNIFLHDLNFVKSSYEAYQLETRNINSNYLILKNKYLRDNYKSCSKNQLEKNKIKKLYDNLVVDSEFKISFAFTKYINKLITHCWKVNQNSYFLNKSQINFLLELNLKLYKLVPGKGFSIEHEKKQLVNDLLIFLSSHLFKKDMQFDSLLSPLKSLDQWFVNRISMYLSNNPDKLALLYKCANSLKQTSEALRSEHNIVLSSNILLDTYKSELELNLKAFSMILSCIEEDFLILNSNSNSDNSSNPSCLPINKYNIKNNFIQPSVFLDVKDKISGVQDTLVRIDWIRENFR